MNIEMSQAQKNKWSRTSCEGLFQVGMKAHLHHKTQNTCPAHFYITSKQCLHVHSYILIQVHKYLVKSLTC